MNIKKDNRASCLGTTAYKRLSTPHKLSNSVMIARFS